MFYNCKEFNCNLSKWNVHNVEDMSCMFCNCIKFEGKGLENWDVSKVENMCSTFLYCINLSCNLNKWDVSNITKMHNIFDGCTSLINKPTWYKK